MGLALFVRIAVGSCLRKYSPPYELMWNLTLELKWNYLQKISHYVCCALIFFTFKRGI